MPLHDSKKKKTSWVEKKDLMEKSPKKSSNNVSEYNQAKLLPVLNRRRYEKLHWSLDFLISLERHQLVNKGSNPERGEINISQLGLLLIASSAKCQNNLNIQFTAVRHGTAGQSDKALRSMYWVSNIQLKWVEHSVIWAILYQYTQGTR